MRKPLRLQELSPVVGKATTLALLTLSQVLAVGALSVTPLGRNAIANGIVAAMIAATVGGFFVAAVARTRAEITAPASSIAVIYAVLGADLVAHASSRGGFAELWAALSLAVVIMGLILMIAGWLRLADAIKFMPSPVNAGFVTGIGLLVIWSQLGHALGLESGISKYHWPEVLERMKPASVLVAGGTILVMWGYPKWFKRGQAALAALLAGTALYYALAWLCGAEQLGPTIHTIAPASTAESNARAVWSNIGGSWLIATAALVLPYSAFLALQAIMNAAVTASATAGILGERSDVNRTLKAQGLANVLCGAAGALPVTTAASLSLPAARMKPKGAALSAAACVILLVVIVAAGDLLGRIPLAVLSGILILAGVNMIDRWALTLATSIWRGDGRQAHVVGNLVTAAAVAAVLFLGSVPLALLAGSVLAMVFLALNLSRATTFDSVDAAELASARVWPAEQTEWLAAVRGTVTVFRPRGGLFFGTADALAQRLDAIGPDTRFCVLDIARLTTLDATGCQIVSAGARKLAGRGVVTVLAGLKSSEPRARELMAIGLSAPDQARWFADLDHALEWVEAELLKDRWPEIARDMPVDVADSPLTKGLSADELRELRSCLARVDVEAGPLFHRGDPGDSMYVIDKGLVEIRVSNHGTAGSTRLAAFGPGSIFGEIAMLTAGKRTADALCVKPATLYQFKRVTLLDLEKRSPELHSRIVSNLNLHLANRLVAATGVLQRS